MPSHPPLPPTLVLTNLAKKTEQVDDWFTNHRRRGYPQQRYQYHAAALASIDAAYVTAVEESRRAADIGGDVRTAADAKVARLAALKDEAEDRLQKASEAWDEHKGRRNGRRGAGGRREGEEL